MKHSHEASPETSSPVLSHFTLSSSSFLSKESARRVCAQVSQDLFSKRYPGTTVWTRSHSCHLTAPYDCDKKPLFPSLVPHPVGQEPEASQRRAALEMKTPGKLTHHLGQWHLLCFRHNQHIRRAVSGRCQNWGGISPKEECPLTRQYCISLHSSSKLPFSAQIHELAGEFDHLSLGILISFHQSSNALFSDFNLKKHSNVHPCVNSSGTELPDIMRHMVKPVGWGQRRRLRCPPEALGLLGGRGQWTSPCEETGGALTVAAESLCVWGQDVLHSACASSLCPFPLLSVPSSLISFSVPLCHPGTTCPLAPIFPPFTYKILSLLRFSFLTSPPSSPHISQSLQTNGNSPQSEARRKHPSPKIQGTEPAWRTGIMSDISQGREKKATDDNKNVARCHDNHSHSATVPRVWRQQNQLHVYFPSTTRLSKQEEAKKEMPPVLCPSPAREPGYLVAAGLPFSKQPSVVTSLSAEPDSSLVSTGFQSAVCPGEEAQFEAGVSGPHLGAHGQHGWVAAGPRRLSANKIMSVVGKVGGGAPPNKTGSSILIKSKT